MTCFKGQVGRRTDIFFQDRCSPGRGYISWQWVGSTSRVSQGHCDPFVRGSCETSMGSIVYRGNTHRWEAACAGESIHNDVMRDVVARRSFIPTGIERDVVVNAALDIRGFTRCVARHSCACTALADPPYRSQLPHALHAPSLHNRSGGATPTTGFHALLTMALACKSVRLYGFAGSANLDGHGISASHGIAQEHLLLDRLVAHTLRMPASLRDAWATADVTVIC